MNEALEKLCVYCNRHQLIDRFGIDRKQVDGRNRCCKTCRSEMDAARRERRVIVAPPSGEKSCTLCGEVKPVSAFGRHRGRSDGLSAWCRDCRAATHAAYLAIHGAERNRRRRRGGRIGGKLLPRRPLDALRPGEVPLPHGKSAWVDIEDWGSALRHLWHENGYGYAASYTADGERLLLHRFILRLAVGEHCDHIDRDRLNCRRSNLRACTPAQNLRNKGPRRDSKLGIKGVRPSKGGRFEARIQLNGTKIYLGTFGDTIAAARAYDKAAQDLFGEFAWLNGI